jgi:O-antigen/teichoic acid export membrane protein
MRLAEFLRSGAIYGIANVLSAGVPFLLLPVLTRVLPPAEFGEVITFFMLTSLCAATAGIGLHGAIGVRWLDPSRGDPRSFTATALLLVLLTTAVTGVLAAIIAPLFGLAISRAACMLAAIVAGATVVQTMRFAIWQSRGQPVPAATLQVLAAVVNMTLSLIGVLVLQAGANGRIGGAALAGLLVAVVCAYSMFSTGAATRATRGDARALLRFGLPLVPHVLAGAMLTNADRLAVAGQLNTATLGVYGAASQLGLVMSVVSDAAIKAYTPIMYRLLRDRSARSKLCVVAITYLSVPFWILAAVAIWSLYAAAGQFLLGEKYLQAVPLTLWFLLGGAANGVYNVIAGLFFFTGRTELISVATLTAALTALLVSAVAVHRFGVIGGAATYMAAHIVLCTVAWTLSRWATPMPWGRPLLAGRVLFAAFARHK